MNEFKLANEFDLLNLAKAHKEILEEQMKGF